jgi:hypothetical protein
MRLSHCSREREGGIDRFVAVDVGAGVSVSLLPTDECK